MKRYYSEFVMTLVLPDDEEGSIFDLVGKISQEVRNKCPEMLEYADFDELNSEDFEDSMAPRKLIINGYIEALSPGEYATAKQMVQMTLIKYKQKYGLQYSFEHHELEVEEADKKKLKTQYNQSLMD